MEEKRPFPDLQSKAEKVLEKNGWRVLLNADYIDPVTGKIREKDILATKARDPLKNGEFNYKVRLFIECKCLSEKTKIDTIDTQGVMSSIENTILTQNMSFAEIREIERTKKFHFYDAYNKIAKRKDSKDLLYKAENQNLAAFAAFRKSHPKERGVYYLIIVCDKKLKCKREDKYEEKCSKILIQINTIDAAHKLPHGRCFIELITIGQFENLLQEIEKDIKEIDFSIEFYHNRRLRELEKIKREIKDDRRFY